MKPIWLFGPPGSGKTTLGWHVQRTLSESNKPAVFLDSDEMRRGPMLDVGFSEKDRQTNIRRLALFANMLNLETALPIVAAVTPTEALRALAYEGCHPMFVFLSGRENRLWPGTAFEPPEHHFDIEVSLNTGAVYISLCVDAIVTAYTRGGWLRS